MSNIEQELTEFLAQSASLLKQTDRLSVDTAIELYGMYDEMSKTATAHIKEIDPELRVQICADMDEILERIIEDMPVLKTDCRNIYTPSIMNFDRWTNVELMKDCGVVVYKLGKETGLRPVMIFGETNTEYPYLDILPGLELISTDEPPGDINVYYRHLSENYHDMDVLVITGIYRFVPPYINMYKKLRPDGKVYLQLDMNRHWMERVEWDSDEVRKAASNCDCIATSCRTIRDTLNRNPGVNFPCRWITNGFYNPTGVQVAAEPSIKENIILTVGRIGTDQKNNIELMGAFAIAAEALPGWSLRFAGPIEPGFQSQIDEYFRRVPEMTGRVIFTGPITDKAKLYNEYAKAKIFALSSRMEGFPNAYSEALFHGCMFVTSDIDAADDMTKNGELGMVYKYGDVQTLAACLATVGQYAADNKVYEKYIPRALAYANRYYDWNRIAKKLAYMLFRDNREEKS